MSEDTEHSSLRALLDSADAWKDELSSFPDSNSDEYQTKLHSAIAMYARCKDIVARASVFSLNESLDDLATSDMRCLIIPFSIAELHLKVQSLDRKAVIQRSMELYKEFITLCDAYNLVTPVERSAAGIAVIGRSVSVFLPDPGSRRNAKIAQFKIQKELKSKIQFLARNPNAQEEDIRLYHKASLKLAIMQTIQALEIIVLELDMLVKAPLQFEESIIKQQDHDIRSYRPKSDGYNDKLDKIANHINGGSMLTQDGKPLRPFTLVNKRQKVKDGVFQTSHSLPTMTINEFLEEEKKRGGMIEGGGEKSGERQELDEDDWEKVDRETIKAREWDEFKEQNPRGSGNTLNRG